MVFDAGAVVAVVELKKFNSFFFLLQALFLLLVNVRVRSKNEEINFLRAVELDRWIAFKCAMRKNEICAHSLIDENDGIEILLEQQCI